MASGHSPWALGKREGKVTCHRLGNVTLHLRVFLGAAMKTCLWSISLGHSFFICRKQLDKGYLLAKGLHTTGIARPWLQFRTWEEGALWQ